MSFTILVTDFDGKEHALEATPGFTIMEIIRDAGLDLEAICGGCVACATCHCYINEEWLEKLEKADDDEESMLDQAYEVKKNSRLTCQITFNEKLDGMKLILGPKF
ncbi:MAG: ferredoxin [Pelagibacteraceae bacterium]|jgi:2Fe-2S ferredoxin|nr:ferredoxin [Pelagibacteraceae bacterium]|tara:strand:- start:93 stop:410 length:318 start_codon:yes stop_codon:yes gene_type:complete